MGGRSWGSGRGGFFIPAGIKGSEGMAGSWGSGRMILSTLSEVGRIS